VNASLRQKALINLNGLFEYQMKETDFVTNILVRKIADVSNTIDLLR
jgi:hypothetical protein